MAGIDVGGSGGRRRSTNSDINMIPFIDLLMCTIAFLLITAVWVTNSRIRADAQVPGQSGCGADCAPVVERVMHLSVGENDFTLSWKREATVLSEIHIPRAAGETVADAMVRFPDLAKAVEKDWGQYREHFDPADKKLDTVILHTDNKMPFKELVGVLDAVNATQRVLKGSDGKETRVPAFNPTFAMR